MTTPAAADAAPAAATPAAAPVEAPVVDPAAPAPAPVVAASLLPDNPEAAAAAAPAPAAEAPKPEASHPEWLLADGTKGTGAAPEWYKADKYKTVAEQAKAYGELEKRFGTFKGAPKDGKYEVPKMPDGIEGEFLVDVPVFEELTKWGIEKGLSQEGYSDLLGMVARYEAYMAPNMEEIKKDMGPNADARIANAAQYLKANLDAEGYKAAQAALGQKNAGEVLSVIEALIAKNRVVVPKPGVDVSDAQGSGLAAIDAMRAKLGPDGKRLFDSDPVWRAECEKALFDHFANAA